MKISVLSQIKDSNGVVFEFKDVIESVEGHTVIKFDNPELLAKLKTAAQNTVDRNNTSPNPYKGRINEFGNYIQKLFAEECRKVGIQYSTPYNAADKSKESGYPDGFVQEGNYCCYVEVKTYANYSKESSLRTFYYSPSKTSKITLDASHILIGFATKSENAQGPHHIVDFHFTDMFSKKVRLKLEFNQNNKELYKEQDLI